MRGGALALLLVVATGCYGSHGLGADSPRANDAGVDAGIVDATVPVAPPSPPSGEAVRCGPNQCLAGEICCDSVCGACTLPEDCVDYECGIGP